MDVESAHAMFDSLNLLKSRLKPRTHVFPGHTYVRPPGQKFSELSRYNIYLQFADRHSFAAYRLRSGQSEQKLFDFR
jgi:hydroxyacylglutathione hydrolase